MKEPQTKAAFTRDRPTLSEVNRARSVAVTAPTQSVPEVRTMTIRQNEKKNEKRYRLGGKREHCLYVQTSDRLLGHLGLEKAASVSE